MFSFLGLRKDPKKSSEKETDGGFVIIGEQLFIQLLVIFIIPFIYFIYIYIYIYIFFFYPILVP